MNSIIIVIIIIALAILILYAFNCNQTYRLNKLVNSDKTYRERLGLENFDTQNPPLLYDPAVVAGTTGRVSPYQSVGYVGGPGVYNGSGNRFYYGFRGLANQSVSAALPSIQGRILGGREYFTNDIQSELQQPIPQESSNDTANIPVSTTKINTTIDDPLFGTLDIGRRSCK